MGQSVGGTPQVEVATGEVTKLGSSKLVVQDVEVVHIREVVKVPVLQEVVQETVRYEPRTETTVRYETTVAPTTRYDVSTLETTRYTVRDEETVRYVPKTVECEKPVVVDKLYERPVIQEKTYQLVSFTDLEAIKEAMALLPKLIEEVKELRKVRIVEEVVKVPKLEFVPTTVMRITKSGELVKDAD